MVFAHSSTTTPRYNPYESRRVVGNGAGGRVLTIFGHNDQPRPRIMGIQSQLRQGSVNACKKRATSAKHAAPSRTQLTMEGGMAFDRLKDCRICVFNEKLKRGEKIRKIKRSHHDNCIFNTKTHGLSVTSV